MNTAAPQTVAPLVILDAAIKTASRNTDRKNRELERAFQRGTGIIGASHTAAMALQMQQGLERTRVDFDRLMAAVRDDLLLERFEGSDLERGIARRALADAYLAAGGKL